MLKKNFKEVAQRNKKFLSRQMMDGILFKAFSWENPWIQPDARDKTWTDRDCLAITDKKWVLKKSHTDAMWTNDMEDDSIPEIYPTSHFGEAICSGMLGGNIRFVGNEYTTCSGAEPLIKTMEDFNALKIDENNHWVKAFADAAKYFADQTNGDYWLKYFITIDALNLVVELMGTTEAYTMVYDDEDLFKKIMEFGVDFGEWFYKLQKGIYEKNSRAALEDPELYDLFDKTWYSIDAYDICDPEMYKNYGLEYQQELINRVGGGMLHTHATGLLRLLPEISKLKGLGVMQIGRDLYSNEWLPFDHIHDIRKMTGDTPLRFEVNTDEFLQGIKNKTLPGGIEYLCTNIKSVDEANRLADMAKEYRV